MCTELHLYRLHFSSDLDNTRYRKSLRMKLRLVTASFVKNATVKSTFFVKVVATPYSKSLEGSSEGLENGDEGRHGTIQCVSCPREADKANRSLLPSQTLVPLPPRTPTRSITPATFSHKHPGCSIKNQHERFHIYKYYCVNCAHRGLAARGSFWNVPRPQQRRFFLYHLSH